MVRCPVFPLLPETLQCWRRRLYRSLGAWSKACEEFLRNGRKYPGEIAARLLQSKWEQRPDVRTVDAFVREIGSESGTTGKAYEVVQPDGSKQSMAEWLKGQAAAARGDRRESP